MKLGEYELNKIYNEDCYEAIKKIPDKSIDLVIIDPPYEYTTGGKGKNQEGEYKKLFERKYANREELEKFTNEGLKSKNRIVEYKKANRYEIMPISSGFDYSLLDILDKKMKHIYIYIWCSKWQVEPLLKHYIDKGCNFDILTWHRTNPLPTMNNTYANDTEYCIMAREKGTYLGGTYETKRKYYVSKSNTEDKDLYEHPTIKPLNIIKNLIINSSKEGDIVLDTFMGSGTTAVACKELGRNFIGFELNPKYCKIAQDRLNGICKEDREKRESGQLSLDDFM